LITLKLQKIKEKVKEFGVYFIQASGFRGRSKYSRRKMKSQNIPLIFEG